MSGTPRRAMPAVPPTGRRVLGPLRALAANVAPVAAQAPPKSTVKTGVKRGRPPATDATVPPPANSSLPAPPHAPGASKSAAAAAAAAATAAAAASAPPVQEAPQQHIITCVRIKPIESGQRDGFQEGRGSLTMDLATGKRVLEFGGAGESDAGISGSGQSAASSSSSSSSAAAAAAPSSGKSFAPDSVFGPGAGQGEVYAGCARDLVMGVFGGTNASIIAYGQTGSGKTHTMLGEPGSATLKGIIPRALEDLFAQAAALAGVSGPGSASSSSSSPPSTTAATFSASYVEIYNESVYDLLGGSSSSSSAPPTALRIREESDGSFFLEDVTRVSLTSPSQALEVLAGGFGARRTSSTAMNARSSRSHAILTITCEVRAVVTVGVSATTAAAVERSHVRTGVLDIVDLAGSERQRDTGAEGTALKEAGKINNSLGSLAEAIKTVVDNQLVKVKSGGGSGSGSGNGGGAPPPPSRPVPWRNSKLTMLLKRSLTGNSRTAMVFTISPAVEYWSESLNTLLFADRARRLKTEPSTNERTVLMGGTGDQIAALQWENDALKAQLAKLMGAGGGGSSSLGSVASGGAALAAGGGGGGGGGVCGAGNLPPLTAATLTSILSSMGTFSSSSSSSGGVCLPAPSSKGTFAPAVNGSVKSLEVVMVLLAATVTRGTAALSSLALAEAEVEACDLEGGVPDQPTLGEAGGAGSGSGSSGSGSGSGGGEGAAKSPLSLSLTRKLTQVCAALQSATGEGGSGSGSSQGGVTLATAAATEPATAAAAAVPLPEAQQPPVKKSRKGGKGGGKSAAAAAATIPTATLEESMAIAQPPPTTTIPSSSSSSTAITTMSAAATAAPPMAPPPKMDLLLLSPLAHAVSHAEKWKAHAGAAAAGGRVRALRLLGASRDAHATLAPLLEASGEAHRALASVASLLAALNGECVRLEARGEDLEAGAAAAAAAASGREGGLVREVEALKTRLAVGAAAAVAAAAAASAAASAATVASTAASSAAPAAAPAPAPAPAAVVMVSSVPPAIAAAPVLPPAIKLAAGHCQFSSASNTSAPPPTPAPPAPALVVAPVAVVGTVVAAAPSTTTDPTTASVSAPTHSVATDVPALPVINSAITTSTTAVAAPAPPIPTSSSIAPRQPRVYSLPQSLVPAPPPPAAAVAVAASAAAALAPAAAIASSSAPITTTTTATAAASAPPAPAPPPQPPLNTMHPLVTGAAEASNHFQSLFSRGAAGVVALPTPRVSMEDPKLMGGSFESRGGEGKRMVSVCAPPQGTAAAASAAAVAASIGGAEASARHSSVSCRGSSSSSSSGMGEEEEVGEEEEERRHLSEGGGIMGEEEEEEDGYFPPQSARPSTLSTAETFISVGSSISVHMARLGGGGGGGGDIMAEGEGGMGITPTHQQYPQQQREEGGVGMDVEAAAAEAAAAAAAGERVEALAREVLQEAILSARKARMAKGGGGAGGGGGGGSGNNSSSSSAPLPQPVFPAGEAPVAAPMGAPPAPAPAPPTEVIPPAAKPQKKKLAALFGKV